MGGEPHSLKYALPACAWLGLQTAWAAQFTFSSPTLATLGLSQQWLSYAWLIGPIAGIIVQPIVGVYSDVHRSPYGRRRPFIAVGAFLTVLGLIGFSSARDIGLWLGDDDKHPIGLTLAIIFFILLDFSINAMQGPLRALVCDVIEPRYHVMANSSFSLFGSFGMGVGYALGIPDLKSYGPWSWASTDVMAVFYTCALILAIGVSIGLQTHETPYNPPPPLSSSSSSSSSPPQPISSRTIRGDTYFSGLGNGDDEVMGQHERDVSANEPEETAPVEVVKNVYRALLHLPKPIARIFAVQSMAYFAWFAVFIYASDWMASWVYGGSSNSNADDYDVYEDGVRAASLGFMLMCIVSVCLSFFLPYGIRLIGHGKLYMVLLICFGITLLNVMSIPEGGNKAGAVTLLALLGIPRSGADSISWNITTRFLAEAHAFGEEEGAEGKGKDEAAIRAAQEEEMTSVTLGEGAALTSSLGTRSSSDAAEVANERGAKRGGSNGDDDGNENELKSFVGEYHLNSGLFTAVFNLSQCIMEFAIACFFGPIAVYFGGERAALATGGLGAFVAAALCLRVIEPGPSKSDLMPSSYFNMSGLQMNGLTSSSSSLSLSGTVSHGDIGMSDSMKAKLLEEAQ